MWLAHREGIHWFQILESFLQLFAEEHYDVAVVIFIVWDAEKFFLACSEWCLVDSGLALHFPLIISLGGTIYVIDLVPVFSER